MLNFKVKPYTLNLIFFRFILCLSLVTATDSIECMNQPKKKTYLSFIQDKAHIDSPLMNDPIVFTFTIPLQKHPTEFELKTKIKASKKGYNNFYSITGTKEIIPTKNSSKIASWMAYSIDNLPNAKCYINFIKTNEEYQNQGLARALIENLEDELLQCNCAKIKLIPNKGIRKFFLNLRFIASKNDKKTLVKKLKIKNS